MMRRTARGLAAAALVVAATLSAAPPLSAQLLNDPFGSESVGISAQDWTLMKNAMAKFAAQGMRVDGKVVSDAVKKELSK